ncbi:hypothetical protein BESB_075480 [Besnoitia besnoiti]|uniref:Ribosomal L1p/L10e family protein n=1 Tax=Besnoitia besnoiti TaxID=94643 RepID=A0A2A9MEN0_BESBE|nr:uncharacterized protein BESB_075480 [Besnoitia besnoiti]PFH34396.1 hypothetical protein BESB_075480 [Besnoitia besnoiti]
MVKGQAGAAAAASGGKKRAREEDHVGVSAASKHALKKKKGAVSAPTFAAASSASVAQKKSREASAKPAAPQGKKVVGGEEKRRGGAEETRLPQKKKQRTYQSSANATNEAEKIPGCNVSPALLRKALAGLTAYVMKKAGEKGTEDLLQEKGSATISLMLSLKNIPQTFRKHPVQIVLPHPLNDVSKGEGECCLFVKDPQRKWKDILAPEKLPGLTRVMGISKLKKKFPTFQDKRMLCATYDMFLCDRKIADRLTPVLGKPFIQSKKLPLPVKLSASNVRPALEEALRSTYFFLPRGPCVAVKVGKANMPADRLFENAKKALEAAFAFFANDAKFRNTIHAVSVQATDAPALPIYSHASYAEAARHYVSATAPAPPPKAKETNKAAPKADKEAKAPPKAAQAKAAADEKTAGKTGKARATRPLMRLNEGDVASKKRKLTQDVKGKSTDAAGASQAKKKLKVRCT